MKRKWVVFFKEVLIKRKWIIFSFLVLLFMASGSTRRNPTVNFNFNWKRNIGSYLSNSVWTYDDGKELFIISSKTMYPAFVKIIENGNDKEFEKCSKLEEYYVGYHQDSLDRAYPYLSIGNKAYDFIEINEDSFTIAKFDHGKPCTFTRKEKVLETKMGKYQYNGKTYFLYLTNHSGSSITDEEAHKSYEITPFDTYRFRIEESIFSDIPVYRWWEDEEGNLCLLSEGYDFSGMSNEEILNTYPIIVLEKVIE